MYEVWYEVRDGEGSEWKLYTPLPANAKEAGKAVEKIVASKDWILITVSKAKTTEKPHHD